MKNISSYLNEKYIKDFSGSTIFERGFDYYESGNVKNLIYSEKDDKISANVSGSYGSYKVKINNKNDNVDANCSCPYEGYPCKHIVAVLLEFVKNNQKYKLESKNQGAIDDSLNSKIKNLPKKVLEDIIINAIDKYPNFKRDMLIMLKSDDKKVLNDLKKQIYKILPDDEESYYEYDYEENNDLDDEIDEFNKIIESISNNKDPFKLEIYLTIISEIVEKDKESDMSNDNLNNVALSVADKIIEILNSNPKMSKDKKDIINQFVEYYIDRSSLSDDLLDKTELICSSKEDYLIVIKVLEDEYPKAVGWRRNEIKNYIAYYYEEIDEPSLQLLALQKDLKTADDYFDLVKFFIKKEDFTNALETALRGYEKAEDDKKDIYNFLETHYHKDGKYDKIMEILNKKIDNNEKLDISSDSSYKILIEFYIKTSKYDNILKLMKLRLINKSNYSKLYIDAKNILKPKDFIELELEIFVFLKLLKKNQWGFDSNLKQLAEIYSFNKDKKNLFDTASQDINLLIKYQNDLVDLYYKEYITQYENSAVNLINSKTRRSYGDSTVYLLKIKGIYLDTIKNSTDWNNYIINFKNRYPKLPALQDELRKKKL